MTDWLIYLFFAAAEPCPWRSTRRPRVVVPHACMLKKSEVKEELVKGARETVITHGAAEYATPTELVGD
jgi:hypothetical protein